MRKSSAIVRIMALCMAFALLLTSATSALADETVDIAADGSSATATGVPFGISDFARYNTGTSKTYDGQDLGYRYPMIDSEGFAVVVTADTVLMFVPPETAEADWFRPSEQSEAGFVDEQDYQPLIDMLAALDTVVSNGGVELASTERRFILTTDYQHQLAGSEVDSSVEVEPGHYYITVKPSQDSLEPQGDVQFVLTGHLVAASEVSVIEAPSGFAALQEFLYGIDYRPFWVSLKTAAVAMIFVFILGLLAAQLSLKINSRFKGVLDSLFTIPMVLPPTVCGFLLLVMFGNSTEIGRWLIDHGISLVFSWPAAVIAAIVVSFPLMYRTARGAFEALDPALLDAARTLGWGEARIFSRLMLPLAWPSIAAGTVLAFARAMGEFGATLFVAGNYAGVTQTMPIAIYFQWMGGHSDVATFWVFVVILISFVVILFINWYASHTQRFRQGSADLPDEPPIAPGMKDKRTSGKAKRSHDEGQGRVSR